MRNLLKLVVLLAAAGHTNSAFANFLVQRLPKEGEAVYYHLELKGEGQKDPMVAELIVKTLNRTTEDGEPCRWLEFVIRDLNEGKPIVHMVQKILVSEQQIGNGKSSLDGIKRIWVGGTSLKARRVEQNFAKTKDAYLAAFFLPNAFKEMSELNEAKTVEYQSGKLVAKAGTKALKTFQDGQQSAKCHYQFWSHGKVPTGLLAAKVEFQDLLNPNRPRTTTFVFTLKKIETGAKTLLPDAK